MLLLLLLCLLLSFTSSQSSSLRVNTHIKEVNAIVLPMPSIQGTGNICTREELYDEVEQVPEMHPVRVRTSSWCLEIPPRCFSYKTEMREVMREQRLNKTRTVRFCCQGYEGNLSDSHTSCKPICRGGCGRGTCLMPDICSCEEGYIGKHCTQRCDHDRWGLECKNSCRCKNDAVCDNKTGACHCIAGWAGEFCEQPCPAGTHGVMCRKACECAERLCHPQTGDCIWQSHLGAVNMSNVMENINSTMVNLTHNINNIAKRIGSFSEDNRKQTPPSPLPEVILIRQPVQESLHTPKIILHESSNTLLENLHTAAAAGVPSPEVFHVITNADSSARELSPRLNLAGFASGEPSLSNSEKHNDVSLLSTLIIILLILIVAVTLGFLYVYRRYHIHKEAVIYNANGTITAKTSFKPEVEISDLSALGKIFHGPLPNPPATPTAKQPPTNEVSVPELYELSSNNSSVRTPPYAYARKESLYSVIAPKSRKGSLESHLYDEIHYHQQHQQHHQHQPHTSHLHYQHLAPPASIVLQNENSQSNNASLQHQKTPQSSHFSNLIIPPQNSNYLQVPNQLKYKKVVHL